MFTRPVPRWIPLGGFILTCSAGCINAIGLLSFTHSGISHMSGNLSLVGIELGRSDFASAARTVWIIVSFFFGCVLSGIIIRESTLQLGRRYGVALTCEASLLVLAAWFLRHGQGLGAYFAAAACGLQNALATSYSGAVVRTTHVTGMVTDLGIAVSVWARRQPVDWRRMRLYLVLLLGFFSGSLLGAIGFLHFRYDTLFFPAALSGFGGIVYGLYQHRVRLATHKGT